MSVMIRLDDVSKVYRTRGGDVTALAGASLEVDQGEFVSIMGASGCGKSTLLMTIGGLLLPTRGSVHVGGDRVDTLSGAGRAAFRARHVGFVFQLFHLVPYLSVLENVLLRPRASTNGNETRARELLERFGLTARANHRPGELSVGERQRAALARAVLTKPKLILADEPTGNLDPENEKKVCDALAEYRDEGGTVLVVTHGEAASVHADRTLRMESGKLQEER